MTQANCALAMKARIFHNAELYRYFLTRNFRKNIAIYNFLDYSNDFKKCSIKDYKDFEKSYKSDKVVQKNNKKVIKL